MKAGDKIAVLGDVHTFNMKVYGDTAIPLNDTNVYFSVTFNPAAIVEGELEQFFHVTDSVTNESLEGALIDLMDGATCTTDANGYCVIHANYEQVYQCHVSLIPYETQTVNITIGADPIMDVAISN